MSLDEDLRAELRRTAEGAPSRRRIVELSRLAFALEAALPEAGELRFTEGLIPRSVRAVVDVGTWAAMRGVFRGDPHGPRRTPPASRFDLRAWSELEEPALQVDYGVPAWTALAAQVMAEDADWRTVNADNARPWRSRTLLRPSPTSDPACAPEAARSALDAALATLPERRKGLRRFPKGGPCT